MIDRSPLVRNSIGVTFTPFGGKPIEITGVCSAELDEVKLPHGAGRQSRISIYSPDLAALRAYPVGTVGKFELSHLEEGSPRIVTYTLSRAVVTSNPIEGSQRQFGLGLLTLTAFSPDPVAVTF